MVPLLSGVREIRNASQTCGFYLTATALLLEVLGDLPFHREILAHFSIEPTFGPKWSQFDVLLRNEVGLFIGAAVVTIVLWGIIWSLIGYLIQIVFQFTLGAIDSRYTGWINALWTAAMACAVGTFLQEYAENAWRLYAVIAIGGAFAGWRSQVAVLKEEPDQCTNG